ncbi:MAG: hypothetical protein BMS9Abin33_1139 [Gammaproteobacteria bacterium]|nr:MAG: hypothetical protein BMS9Abin33_1139 [Gammaproteobacteria bacterium]
MSIAGAGVSKGKIKTSVKTKRYSIPAKRSLNSFGLCCQAYHAHFAVLVIQLLSRTQGTAVISHAYHDKKFLQSETKAIDDWLDSLV